MDFKKETSAGFLANHMARLFAGALAAGIKPLGLAPAQFMVLLELWEEDGQTQSQLSRRLSVEQATMANTLARMARDGLVRFEPSPMDRRAKLVCATSKSKALEVPAKAAAAEINAEVLSGLDPQERAALIGAMQKVIAALGRRNEAARRAL